MKDPLALKAKGVNKCEEKNPGFFCGQNTVLPLDSDVVWNGFLYKDTICSARAGLTCTELEAEWLSFHYIFSMHESCNLQTEYLSIDSKKLCSFAEALNVLGEFVVSKICGKFWSY